MNDELVKLNQADKTKARAITTSLIIAEYFGKRHDVVLRDIRKLLKEVSKKALRNFVECSYTNENNRQFPYYELTRDGWMLLVMGYNGKKAMEIKEKFLEQFNRMEDVIRLRVDKLPAYKIENRNYCDFIKFSISGENPADHFVKWSFKVYKDLIYKKALGETAGQRRKRLGMKEGGNVANTLEIEELDKINHWMHIVRDKVLDEGWVKLKANEAYRLVKEWLGL